MSFSLVPELQALMEMVYGFNLVPHIRMHAKYYDTADYDTMDLS